MPSAYCASLDGTAGLAGIRIAPTGIGIGLCMCQCQCGVAVAATI